MNSRSIETGVANMTTWGFRRIHLTARGKKALQTITRVAHEHEDALCAGLNASEPETLAQLLYRVLPMSSNCDLVFILDIGGCVVKGLPTPNGKNRTPVEKDGLSPAGIRNTTPSPQTLLRTGLTWCRALDCKDQGGQCCERDFIIEFFGRFWVFDCSERTVSILLVLIGRLF
jgi:hypothetical protein